MLELELDTSLSFTTHCRICRQLRRQSIALTTALRNFPRTQSRRLRTIMGIRIDKHFTLSLGRLTDRPTHNLDGTICRALLSATRPYTPSYPAQLCTALPLT
jgi:hypothetical protein